VHVLDIESYTYFPEFCKQVMRRFEKRALPLFSLNDGTAVNTEESFKKLLRSEPDFDLMVNFAAAADEQLPSCDAFKDVTQCRQRGVCCKYGGQPHGVSVDVRGMPGHKEERCVFSPDLAAPDPSPQCVNVLYDYKEKAMSIK